MSIRDAPKYIYIKPQHTYHPTLYCVLVQSLEPLSRITNFQ